MLFTDFHGLLRIILISVLAYAALIALLRFAGKRSLAKFDAFDFVVSVAFGSTLATVVLSKDVPLAEGLLAFVLLVLLQWVVSRVSIASPKLRNLFRNQPRLLLENGHYREDAMKKERVTRSEVDAALRMAGVGRVEDAAAVVMETDGSMSVVRRGEMPLTVLDNVRR